MRVLCVICLILAVLRIYTRQERIKRNTEQIEKMGHPKVYPYITERNLYH